MHLHRSCFPGPYDSENDTLPIDLPKLSISCYTGAKPNYKYSWVAI